MNAKFTKIKLIGYNRQSNNKFNKRSKNLLKFLKIIILVYLCQIKKSSSEKKNVVETLLTNLETPLFLN